jgi:hypothetical protein
MTKFHINSKGDAGKCSAAKGGCPFGGEKEHFTSPEAARKAYEDRQAEELVLEAAQRDLTTYGENSKVFTLWSKIHPDFRSSPGEPRRVLANGGASGTVLTPWHGPKVLEKLQAKAAANGTSEKDATEA